MDLTLGSFPVLLELT